VHPYVEQALAAERARDRQRQAAAARRAKRARSARRGTAEVSAERPMGGDQTRDTGRVRHAETPDLEGAARDHRSPIGAGRA